MYNTIFKNRKFFIPRCLCLSLTWNIFFWRQKVSSFKTVLQHLQFQDSNRCRRCKGELVIQA